MSTLKRRPQSEYLSDYEYVHLAKTADASARQRAEFELYMKYIPLIRKHATKFNLHAEDREDFEAEAFFSVPKVLDYVQIDKIDERFSFGYFLRMHLLNQGIARVKKSKKREARVGTQVSYDAVTVNGFTPSELTISDEDFLSSAFVDSDLQAVLDELDRGPLSSRDSRIVADQFKGVAADVTADREGLSKQRVRTIQKGGLEYLRQAFSDTN